jgi:hypothetical protein
MVLKNEKNEHKNEKNETILIKLFNFFYYKFI